jgi:hypothetical protein
MGKGETVLSHGFDIILSIKISHAAKNIPEIILFLLLRFYGIKDTISR